jgi:hypothetical protein
MQGRPGGGIGTTTTMPTTNPTHPVHMRDVHGTCTAFTDSMCSQKTHP